MSKHTPGPWLNGQDGFNLGSGVVYGRHPNGNPKDVATIRGWGGEQQANSRLIAAAPEMLEVLETIKRRMYEPRALFLEEVELMIDKVIAKAKG